MPWQGVHFAVSETAAQKALHIHSTHTRQQAVCVPRIQRGGMDVGTRQVRADVVCQWQMACGILFGMCLLVTLILAR